MRRKNVVSSQSLFVVMSLVLLTVYVGYLFALGSPNPPWEVHDDDSASGSHDDFDAEAYVAYNSYWTGSQWYYQTYHWARVDNIDNPKKTTFDVEFKHRPDAPVHFIGGSPAEWWEQFSKDEDGNDENNVEDAVWERDAAYSSRYSNPDEGVTEALDPYTKVRKGSPVAEAELFYDLEHHD